MNYIYLDDYSDIDNIRDDYEYDSNNNHANKPIINLHSDINKNNEKLAVFNIILPIKDNIITIELLIDNHIYKNIGKILRSKK